MTQPKAFYHAETNTTPKINWVSKQKTEKGQIGKIGGKFIIGNKSRSRISKERLHFRKAMKRLEA